MTNLISNRTGRRFGTLLDPARLLEDLMTWQPAGSEVVWSAMSAPMIVEHSDDGVTITVDMPGVDAVDIDLTVESGVLAIAGKRGERTYNFNVTLDERIDPNTIEAKLDKGVLAVHAQKRPEAKPRKIMVNGGTQKTLDVSEPK